MIQTLDRPAPGAAGMSVVDSNFASKEEVEMMTAITVVQRAYAAPGARRPRPHGLDLLVMRLSLAMLLWARQRADRGVMSHEEHARRRANALAIEHDRRRATALVNRVF